MTKLFGSLLIAAFLFSPLLVTSVKSEARYKLKGSCAVAYKKWKNEPGSGAFAVARNGEGCGWNSGPHTLSSSRLLAVRRCATQGKRCRVIKVRRGKASSSPWVPKGNCAKKYASWKSRPSRSAFAVTKNGYSCGWSNSKYTLKAAKSEALTVCRRNYGRCKIINSK